MALYDKSKTLIILALAAVYVFWGGTYLAMKIGIETIPPFILGGVRFLTAGLLLYIWEISKGQKKPSRSHWFYASLLGFVMLFISQGGILWAQKFVASGIAAIIFATVPLWMTLISWIFRGTPRPDLFIILGLMLGFLGIILQVKSSLIGGFINNGNYIGYIVLLFAAVSWAWGSVYSLVFPLPESPVLSISLQMISGGIFFFAASLLTGEWKHFNMLLISPGSMLSLFYLIVFGSIIGFSAYIWLLKVADTTLVSTYAYVNPIVAVFLGCTLAGEPLTLNDIAAALLILTSVIIISKKNVSRGRGC